MTEFLPVDSGIDTQADLAGILPAYVRELVGRFFIEDYLLGTPQTAAALRVLATIRNPFWWEHVHESFIDWAPLLSMARLKASKLSKSQRVRVEIAASMDGVPGAHAPLLYAARVMERHHYLAVLDALRILVEGLPR